MLSIPLFISFLPTEEFIAFDPSWKPNFAKFSSSPLPDYLRFLFFVRFKITAERFFICFKITAERLNLTFFLFAIFSNCFALFKESRPLFFLLGPVFLTFLT